LCGGYTSFSSDVCGDDAVAETASPPPSTLLLNSQPVPTPSSPVISRQPAAVSTSMSPVNTDDNNNGKQHRITSYTLQPFDFSFDILSTPYDDPSNSVSAEANGSNAVWLILLAIPVCGLMVACAYYCCHYRNSRRRGQEQP